MRTVSVLILFEFPSWAVLATWDIWLFLIGLCFQSLFKVCLKHNIFSLTSFPKGPLFQLMPRMASLWVHRLWLPVSLGSEHTVFSDQLNLFSKLRWREESHILLSGGKLGKTQLWGHFLSHDSKVTAGRTLKSFCAYLAMLSLPLCELYKDKILSLNMLLRAISIKSEHQLMVRNLTHTDTHTHLNQFPLISSRPVIPFPEISL